MAVENKYVNANIVAGNKADPSVQSKQIALVQSGAIAAADDDGSKYHYFRIPSSMRIHGVATFGTTITGCTDVDIGLYYADGSQAVILKDILADGVDVSAAHVPTQRLSVGTNGVAKNLIGLPAWQMAGLASDPHRDFTVAVTANTVGSGAGTLGLILSATGN